MEEIIIFADWEFFQCLHHIGKLRIVEELPYKCVLLEDLFHEESSYSKQKQLVYEIKCLSNISIDTPKDPKANIIYPISDISLIDQYAFILGCEYKKNYPEYSITVCTKFSKNSHEYVDLFDVDDTLYSESLIYSLKRSKILNLDELKKIVSLVKTEHLRDKEYEKYLNALLY